MDKEVAPVGRVFADGTLCLEPGARQSEAAECDINRIVSQFAKTGVLPPGFAEGVFADVSEIGDYRAALERVRLAEAEFMRLPPQVRARFENDPLQLVEFAVNPANRPEMEALGLLPAVEAVVPPVAAEVKP
ncbi:MAG: internal scaffolding protein [Microvirus sp.]|nr:MAG: internal scaffolding protein [Microvirus sp.]